MARAKRHRPAVQHVYDARIRWDVAPVVLFIGQPCGDTPPELVALTARSPALDSGYTTWVGTTAWHAEQGRLTNPVDIGDLF